MSYKTRAVSHVVLVCACVMAGLTQPAATEEKKTMTFQSLTPNLIVNDIDRSVTFYRDVLGFEQVTTVPEEPPFVFVWLRQGTVDVFLNVPQPDSATAPIPMGNE